MPAGSSADHETAHAAETADMGDAHPGPEARMALTALGAEISDRARGLAIGAVVKGVSYLIDKFAEAGGFDADQYKPVGNRGEAD